MKRKRIQLSCHSVEALTSEQAEAEFEGLFTIGPTLNLVPVDDIFIGATQYKNKATFEKIQNELGSTEEFKNFMDTVEVQCFDVFEGYENEGNVKLQDLPEEPKTIEFLFRNIKDGQLENFDPIRQAFRDKSLVNRPDINPFFEYQ